MDRIMPPESLPTSILVLPESSIQYASTMKHITVMAFAKISIGMSILEKFHF